MKIFLLVLYVIPFAILGQIAPFQDYNKFFKTFYKGNFRQLEFQAIKSFEASDNMCVYLDYRGDFKLYDGENIQTLTNQQIDYKLSDGQLAWLIGPGLFCFQNGQKELVTTFGNRFAVSDSLVIYEDTRFNSINYYYKGEKKQLFISTGDLLFPSVIGDNVFVYRDNGDFIKFLWRGKSYDLYVYSREVQFSAGMDVICFNDPLNQTFAVFDQGKILDLENMFARKFQAGRGFVAYEDQQGNLWHYKNGEKQQLSNFSVSKWEVKDDLVFWEENSYSYCFYKGKKYSISNYSIQEYKMKNATIVFKNSVGGVSLFYENKIIEATKQLDCSYQIYGNTVLIELFNKSFLVFDKGMKYEN